MSGTYASRVIRASPEALCAAFMDPDLPVAWLPPAAMTGKIHAFEGRVGGGYRTSLFYSPEERLFRGKTTDREDRVRVRFVVLGPPRRIVEAVSFESPDPTVQGEMTAVGTFADAPGGTEVGFLLHEPAAGPASGGQRGRHAIVARATGATLRVTAGGGGQRTACVADGTCIKRRAQRATRRPNCT